MKNRCAYRLEKTNKQWKGKDCYGCLHHETCVIEKVKRGGIASCDTCPDRLEPDDGEFSAKWKDPLRVVNSRKDDASCLEGMLNGTPTFLVCGGPSAKPHLEALNRRGVFTLAVNNAAAHVVRANAFVCSDPPRKFHHSIWLDPRMMKFVPIPKMNGYRALLQKKEDGVFEKIETKVPDCPNVWGFHRNDWFVPDSAFFETDGACWGNLNSGVKRTGELKTVCTMLLAIRLLYYLGSRRIFLVGVDFHMNQGRKYAFNQERTQGACNSNMKQYGVVNDWLCRLAESKALDKFGLEIFNCCPDSGLRAFAHAPIDKAIASAVGIITEENDLSGWYEKADCPKCKSWHVRFDDGSCECLDCGEKWEIKK